MYKEKIEILNNYLKSGIKTILLEDFDVNIFKDNVILDRNSAMCGHYEGMEYVAPNWYYKLLENEEKIIVINDINKLSLDEQTRYIEIIKYKKVSTFDLPEDTIIILLANNLEKNKLNEEIYSLVAHI